MRALVTNDDGFGSPGLTGLAAAAVDAGFDVVVAAPRAESSGSSAGLTVLAEEGRSVTEPAEDPQLPGTPCHTVAAHPAFIVLAAMDGVFGEPPDVVLSGVNRGVNLGRAIVHSGTVGAALTAGVNELSAMAVSLEVAPDTPQRWVSATAVLPAAFDLLKDMPAGTVLNVNVPNRPPDQLGPLTSARLSSVGVVQSRLQRTGQQPEVVTTITGDNAEPGSDAALITAGSPTVTAVHPVSESGVRLPERIELHPQG